MTSILLPAWARQVPHAHTRPISNCCRYSYIYIYMRGCKSPRELPSPQAAHIFLRGRRKVVASSHHQKCHTLLTPGACWSRHSQSEAFTVRGRGNIPFRWPCAIWCQVHRYWCLPVHREQERDMDAKPNRSQARSTLANKVSSSLKRGGRGRLTQYTGYTPQIVRP